MIRIAITQAAFEAIAKTLPFGDVSFENQIDEHGQRIIWLPRDVLYRLRSLRAPGEDYSGVILRIAAGGAWTQMKREPLQAPPGRSRLAIFVAGIRELADLKSYRQAFRNAAAQVVARAHVRGLAALPSSARSNEARVLAVRMAKAALAFHPQWRDEAHGATVRSPAALPVLTLLQGDGLSVAEMQRQG